MRAMTVMLDGGRVTRKNWPPNKKLFIAHNPHDLGKPAPPIPNDQFPMLCLNETPPDRTDLNWLPEQEDIFGIDWEIV